MSAAREDRLIDGAAATLCDAGHEPVTVDEYGRYVIPGFKVDSSSDVDTVRVEHMMPKSDLLDPDRMGTDEMYLARLAARDAYAATLRAAGWIVEERTVHGNRPILLASRISTVTSQHSRPPGTPAA